MLNLVPPVSLRRVELSYISVDKQLEYVIVGRRAAQAKCTYRHVGPVSNL